MLKKVEAAAELLHEQGISVTVLDLRWLRPLDDKAIAAAVAAGGGRVLVVHEDFLTGGFGAEIAARISERHFSELVEPVARVGSREVRIPSAPSLQSAVIPSVDDIAARVREVVGRER
jgi:2-oxoisovalerate dehydrogenase E1 component